MSCLNFAHIPLDGKVFYIISVKEDKKKVIQNSEVVGEIRKEVERLKNE